jgi:prolipoprotein diacylglyceryltransferase
VTFHEDSFAGATFPGVALHPTQLYLSLAGFANFALVWSLRKQLERRPGQLFFLFLLIESGSRFAIDFFRYYHPGGESVALLGVNLSLTQVVCLVLLGVALAGLLRAGMRPSVAATSR